MRKFLFTLPFLLALATAQAMVVHLAPDFAVPGVGNKTQSLKGLRGSPVVLLIVRSPKSPELKAQVKSLREIYQQFANKGVLFIAAFTEESGLVKSDIPFLIASNGPAVASAYGVPQTPGSRSIVPDWLKFNSGHSDFTIVIIGKDGNIDYQTNKVLLSSRVCDVIQNSYAVQSITGR